MPQPIDEGTVLGGRYRVTGHVVTSADQDMVLEGRDQVLNRAVTILVAANHHASQVATSARELATGDRRGDVQVLDLGLSEGRTYLIADDKASADDLLDLAEPQQVYVEPFYTDTLGSEIFGESRTAEPQVFEDDDEYYSDLSDTASDEDTGTRRPKFLNRISDQLNRRLGTSDSDDSASSGTASAAGAAAAGATAAAAGSAASSSRRTSQSIPDDGPTSRDQHATEAATRRTNRYEEPLPDQLEDDFDSTQDHPTVPARQETTPESEPTAVDSADHPEPTADVEPADTADTVETSDTDSTTGSAPQPAPTSKSARKREARKRKAAAAQASAAGAGAAGAAGAGAAAAASDDADPQDTTTQVTPTRNAEHVREHSSKVTVLDDEPTEQPTSTTQGTAKTDDALYDNAATSASLDAHDLKDQDDDGDHRAAAGLAAGGAAAAGAAASAQGADKGSGRSWKEFIKAPPARRDDEDQDVDDDLDDEAREAAAAPAADTRNRAAERSTNRTKAAAAATGAGAAGTAAAASGTSASSAAAAPELDEDEDYEYEDDDEQRPGAARWLTAAILALLLVVAVVFAFNILGNNLNSTANNGTNNGQATDSPSASQTSEAPTSDLPAPVIAGVSRQVPDSPTLSEDTDNTLPQAIDGNPATAWNTYSFAQPQFGGYASSMALVVELEEPSALNELTITQNNGTGGSFTVLVSDTPEVADGTAIAEGSFTGPQVSIPMSENGAPAEGQYVIINFTQLPQLTSGTSTLPYGLRIAEVEIS